MLSSGCSDLPQNNKCIKCSILKKEHCVRIKDYDDFGTRSRNTVTCITFKTPKLDKEAGLTVDRGLHVEGSILSDEVLTFQLQSNSQTDTQDIQQGNRLRGQARTHTR